MAKLLNPFRYGREIDVLVDRDMEVSDVVRVCERSGTLFFIGPRRFGKTSILKAAEERLTRDGLAVLRYDAEAYESTDLLAASLMEGAMRKFASTLDRAQAVAKKFFSILKPSLSIDPGDGKITVEFGFNRDSPRGQIPLLTDVLNGVERLAAADKRKAVVIIDEFQQVIAEQGEKAERQIRAAVQTHRNVAYVFAGSRARLMTEMIATSNRAFWNLGDQLHLGPIPRPDFLVFLRDGLESGSTAVADNALTHLLDLSEDVPYNVQQLASQCWTLLQEERRPKLTPQGVDQALSQVVSTQHATYMQRWLSLSTAQKQTLKIVIHEPGDFQLAEVARRHNLPRSTMQRALQWLERNHFLRQDMTPTGASWKLEDPFFRAWLAQVQHRQ